MAVPASFAESNAVLSKPDCMTADECGALSILRINAANGMPMVISCWKLTADELVEINRTGRVWLGIIGDTMPPAWVNGSKPFEEVDEPMENNDRD